MAKMSPSMPPSSLSHTVPVAGFESKLSEQLSQQQQQEEQSADDSTTTTTTTTRNKGNRLLESPRIKSGAETLRDTGLQQPEEATHSGSSKDDSSLSSGPPATPQRPSLNPHSLSLDFTPTISNGPGSSSNRTPLSPILDSSQTHGSRFSSPGSVLPRRSRGLDFSRACTNLHLSTLAESSPESSPTIGGRGVAIPPRRGSMGSTSAVHPFSTSGPNDRTAVSSSVSSVNMMESDTSSSDEEDEPMGGDKDDMIFSTPQANKTSGSATNPFAVGNVPSPGTEWMGGYSHAAASLMSFQRARFSKGRSRTRQSSSSTSGKSSKPSPGPLSPPVMKSIENPNGGGYFTGSRNGTQPRRESLSMGAGDLRLSDFSDDGEGRTTRSRSPARGSHSEGSGSGGGGGPLGVIRRAVTRRGNLLPKTKTFARIRAALVEESAPLHSEAKREAEVIRQVRESEPSLPQKSPDQGSLRPAESDRAEPAVDDTPTKQPGSAGLASSSRTSTEFWGSLDERYRTPPPSMRQPGEPSASEDDLTMDMTPSTSTTEFAKPYDRPSSRSSMRNAPHPTPVQEFKRKRAREEDFDPNLFKRRAVSPSMSVQSSPVMSNSSAATDAGSGPNPWGPPPKTNIGSLFPEANTRSSPHTHSGGPFKRFGLQGMTETNDGLMNMSIE